MKHIKLIVFLALAILGAVITPHYGESWDELKFYKYAELSLDAYNTWPLEGTVAIFGNTYDNYGPAFVMLVTLAAKPLRFIFSESDARHYLYYLTFLAGVWAFYELAKRWLSHNAALFSTLLFATQPMLVGHAFISPKDIPFLSLFLLSLHFGLKLFDTLKVPDVHEPDQAARRTVFTFGVLWLAAVFALYLFTEPIHALITDLVMAARAGEANIVSRLASDLSRVPPETYIQRYFVLFLRARSILVLLLSAILFFLIRNRQPAILSMVAGVFLPAVMLGITTSVRILGPFAAVFVAWHAFRKHGRQAILPLTLYGVIAVIAMYLTWPYLWPNPPGHFVESLLVMSQYPWNGQVLFNGEYYPSTALPYSYLPVLFGIQFSEPVWVLTLLGLAAAVAGSREKRELAVFFAAWFLVPFAGFILTRAPLYDNFRQIFFIVPPVFLLSGVLIEKIRDVRWQAAVIVICLLPGIVDAIRLHPYEYIYYNRLAGGVQRAFRKFELDYWGTSYREAAHYINEIATEEADIWVDGPSHIFELYARTDLNIHSDYEATQVEEYDYVVSTSRYNLDQTSHPDAEVVYVIERDHATLTVIKQP